MVTAGGCSSNGGYNAGVWIVARILSPHEFHDFRSGRPILPDVTHHVDAVEQGRVYDISPAVGPYHVRVKSNGPDSTTIELFMPSMIYNAQVRDSLAKCP
jgi:hypothetical protein